MTAIKSQKHFSIRRLPDGGLALIGRFQHGEFAVKLTGKEVATIQRHVVALHKKLHGNGMMSGMGGPSLVRRKIKSAIIGCLRRRLRKASVMGAVASRPNVQQKQPAKRVAQRPPMKPAVDVELRNKIQVINKALAATSQNRVRFLSGGRRAPTPQEIAQGRNYASQGFIRLGLPGNLKPHPFYQGKTVAVVADLAAKAVNQLKQVPKGAQASQAAQSAAKTAPQAGAKTAPKAPQPLKPKSAQMKPVLAGIKVLTIRRAAMLAYEARKQIKPTPDDLKRGQAFAHQLYLREGIPTTDAPSTFWRLPYNVIARKVQLLVLNATKLGAPKTVPVPPIDRSKLQVLRKGIATVTTRRAKFLTQQRLSPADVAQGRNAPVTQPDIRAGVQFAKAFFAKNGVPSPDGNHVFWVQPIQQIATRIAAVVKMAEVQGAPPAKPKANAMPFKAPPGGVILQEETPENIYGYEINKALRAIGFNLTIAPSITDETIPALNQVLPRSQGPWTKIDLLANNAAEAKRIIPILRSKIPHGVSTKPIITQVSPQKVDAVTQGLKLVSDRRAKFMAFHRQAAVPSDIDIRDGKDFAKKFFTENNIPVRLPGKTDTIIGWAAREPYGMRSRYGVGADMRPMDAYLDRERGEVVSHSKVIAEEKLQKVDPVTSFWDRPLDIIQRQVAELVVKARENGAPLEPTGQPVSLNPSPAQGGGGGAPGDVPPGEVPGDMPPGGEVPGEVPPGGETPGEEPPGEMPGEEPAGQIPGEQYQPPYGQPEVPGQMPYDYTQTEQPPGQMEDASYQETSYTEEPGQVPGAYAEPYTDPNVQDMAAPEEYASAETESYATDEYATAETESYATEEYASEEPSAEADPELYLDAPEETFDAAVSGMVMRRRYR